MIALLLTAWNVLVGAVFLFTIIIFFLSSFFVAGVIYFKGIKFGLNHFQHLWIVAFDCSWLCSEGIMRLFAAASCAHRTVFCADWVESHAAVTFVIRNAVGAKLVARVAKGVLFLVCPESS